MNFLILYNMRSAKGEQSAGKMKVNLRVRILNGACKDPLRIPDSKYYQRKCYGYKHDKNGRLIIDEK